MLVFFVLCRFDSKNVLNTFDPNIVIPAFPWYLFCLSPIIFCVFFSG